MIHVSIATGGSTQTLSFSHDEVVIGSAPDADVVLDQPGVAAHHVRLALRDRVLMIEDLRRTKLVPRAIEPTDIIRIARIDLRAWLEVSDDLGKPLLDEIRRRPDDPVPRTVYADWLEQHGHPERAEFLRQQLAASGAKSATDPSFVRAAARLAALAPEVGDTWRTRVSMSFIERCPNTRTPPDDNAPPELGLELVCPMRWDKLTPTDREGVRSCSGCHREVTYCTTIAQARTVALRGGCVALDLGAKRWPNDLEIATRRPPYDYDYESMPSVGMPSPVAPHDRRRTR